LVIKSDEAIKMLKDLIKDGNFNALKLYLEYRFGKPKENVENLTHNFNQEITAEAVTIINEKKEKYN
jgi:hypothetical protein